VSHEKIHPLPRIGLYHPAGLLLRPTTGDCHLPAYVESLTPTELPLPETMTTAETIAKFDKSEFFKLTETEI